MSFGIESKADFYRILTGLELLGEEILDKCEHCNCDICTNLKSDVGRCSYKVELEEISILFWALKE